MNRRVRELSERFGIPGEVFDRLAVTEDQETVFAGTPEVMEFDAVRPMRRGIRLARIYPHSVKPATFGMQALGQQATRNVIELSDEQAKRLINCGGMSIDVHADNGFALLRWRGFIVGVGFYKRPVLKSQFRDSVRSNSCSFVQPISLAQHSIKHYPCGGCHIYRVLVSEYRDFDHNITHP